MNAIHIWRLSHTHRYVPQTISAITSTVWCRFSLTKRRQRSYQTVRSKVVITHKPRHRALQPSRYRNVYLNCSSHVPRMHFQRASLGLEQKLNKKWPLHQETVTNYSKRLQSPSQLHQSTSPDPIAEESTLSYSPYLPSTNICTVLEPQFNAKHCLVVIMFNSAQRPCPRYIWTGRQTNGTRSPQFAHDCHVVRLHW